MREDSEIKYLGALQQTNDFGGLKFHRNIRPSDVDGAVCLGLDGCIDFKGNLFIFFEGKKYGVSMPLGQEGMYNSLCDAIQNSPGKDAIWILYTHGQPNDKVVNVADSICVFYYYKGKKHLCKKSRTVQDVCNSIIDSFKKKGKRI